MSTLDIREAATDEVSKIVFGDEVVGSRTVAHKLTRFSELHVAIGDSSNDKVLLHSKQHALDAIKAIQKAIELEWLK